MKIFAAVLFLSLAGCGYLSRDNEAVGQVKKFTKETPLICPNFSAIDLSLGVMRNGVGSMSSDDIWFYVPESETGVLKKAAEDGSLVKITYNMARINFCLPDHMITKAEPLK